MNSFWKGVGNAMKAVGEARARKALAMHQHILDRYGINIESPDLQNSNTFGDKKKGA
jgi:hypothetical protein